ncbi:MAG: hypothetical protein LBI13_07415 [Streptococcaceae bacterium]|jgi:hypothetical protein|nr:hypothetical protein [Streptococcaceae bacterium]
MEKSDKKDSVFSPNIVESGSNTKKVVRNIYDNSKNVVIAPGKHSVGVAEHANVRSASSIMGDSLKDTAKDAMKVKPGDQAELFGLNVVVDEVFDHKNASHDIGKDAGEAVVGLGVLAVVQFIPGVDVLADAGILGVLGTGAIIYGVGVASKAINDKIREQWPVVREAEDKFGTLVDKGWNDTGKQIGHATKWLGQEATGFMNWLTGKSDSKPEKKSNSRDDYEKSGRMKIQRGGSYSGGQFIALDADQVNALASTISSKSSDYAQKLTAINNSIDQGIADKLKEVRSWAMGKLGKYNYLTPDDVDEILANFTITYDAGAVASSNQKIKTLAQNLAQVSTGLQTAARTMSSTDDSQAQGFKALPSPVSQYKLGFK